jgi:ankyrin repeat protein
MILICHEMSKIPCYLFLAACFLSVICAGCGRGPESSGKGDKPAGNLAGAAESPAISLAEAEDLMRQSSLEGDLAKVKESIEAGADVNAVDAEGHTALMFAAFNGHSGIVLELLGAGAGVDRRDMMGRTALLYASTGPFPETVRILLDKGAKPNVVDSDEHFSPLMHAAAEGNMDVVKILLEAGADPALKDVDGDDAATFARQSGHQAVTDHLESLR